MEGHGKIHSKDWSLSKRFEHLLFDAITDIDNMIIESARAEGYVDTSSLVSALGEVKNTLDDIQNLKDEIYENEIDVMKLKEEIFERAIS